MQTQSSSKARVKRDTIGTEGLKDVYNAFQIMNRDDFCTFCKETIERSAGKRETKDKFIRDLDVSKSKNVMVQMVTNYLLAGQGLGV